MSQIPSESLVVVFGFVILAVVIVGAVFAALVAIRKSER